MRSVVRSPWFVGVVCASPFFVAAIAMRRPARVLHLYTPVPTACATIGVAVMVVVWSVGASMQWHRRTIAATRSAVERDAREERRRLLGRIDHEVKNPLTAIRAGLANLESTGGDPEAVRVVHLQVARLARLLGDLHKLGELETRVLERIPVDLAELLADVVEATDDLLDAEHGARTDPAERVRLVLPQAPWPLPQVLGDRDLLFLAFYNLLTNAVKFSHVDDVIELRAADEAGRVVVEVADTGMGIPADELDAVWGELARGREAHGRPGVGSAWRSSGSSPSVTTARSRCAVGTARERSCASSSRRSDGPDVVPA